MTRDFKTGCDILRASVQNRIATITIDNIKRHNIMTLAAWQALPGVIDHLSDQKDVRAIIIRGAGDRAFVAGADISEFDTAFSGADGLGYDRATVAAFLAVRHAKLPTIAAIRGFCIGGGLALALSCDIRLCSEDSKFSIPAARLGLAYPDAAVHRLKEVVGDAHARDILLTAARFDAAHAAKIGIATRVYPTDEFETGVQSYTRMLLDNAPLSMRAAKITLDEGPTGDQDKIKSAAIHCLESEDYEEGKAAFAQGRTPLFNGR